MVDLCCFYGCYCFYFKTNIRPLRNLHRIYRKSSPIIPWTLKLIILFNYCKINHVTAPLLDYYDRSKPVFSRLVDQPVVWVICLCNLMIHLNPFAVLIVLEKTGKYVFDLTLDGSRLRPIFFGYRYNLPNEK